MLAENISSVCDNGCFNVEDEPYKMPPRIKEADKKVRTLMKNIFETAYR